MDKICIYLRKSRADEEIEKTLGEGETLRKHRKALLKFAKEKELNIVAIKEEVVSADSIFHRPKMVELLQEVEANLYTGVLVMDIQRLGRGDTEDQGIIFRVFKESHTKVITLQKTYDLDNDYDEDYFEFESFMGRKEYKMIKKRMQGGRIRSVEEGNYIATNPPIGYDIYFLQKCRTLKINEDEAKIIKIIFNMYASGNGASSICSHLNMLGLKSKLGNKFSPSSILIIIKNPIYIGKVTWKKKDIRKSKDPNKLTDTKSRKKSEWIVSQGKHQPIIDEELFNTCQDILNNKYHIPYQLTNKPVNPMAGLITCKTCGRKMTMRPLRGVNRLMCTNSCGNKSSKFEYVENRLISELEKYLEKYKFDISNELITNDSDLYKKQYNEISKEQTTLLNQKNKLFDLLERGLYDEQLFLDRSKNIDARINIVKSNLNKIQLLIDKEKVGMTEDSIITFENAIAVYKYTDDVSEKNKLLKNILYKIDYYKDKTQRNDDFELVIYPKMLR